MTTRNGSILIIDDDEDVLKAARLYLKQHVTHVHTEKKPELLPALLKNEHYDVVLLDMNFTRDASSGQEGFAWLNKILEVDPSVVVVLITAYGDVEMAVRAIKEGAMDFVLKPWQNEKLLATINAALRLRQSKREAENLRLQQQTLSDELDQPFTEFIGNCHAIEDVFSTIGKVARTDANVLILGENGTGKELVAREVHRQSSRRDQVFITVDMGALTATLFESELFGHVKGAFTDAKENRAGRFEIASGGTIFLDEIGNISPQMQSRILTVLQSRQVTRLGSNKPVPVDVRLICATNMPIHEMISRKEFRQDLLYRINTVEITLPPLRERATDIPLLVEHFLKIYAHKYNKGNMRVHAATMKKLQKFSWPGNVRELQHAVERAVIMSDSAVLQPMDFYLTATDGQEESLAFENYNLEDAEKIIIRKAIDKYGGNISQAARELGLTRASLYRRLGKYGL